MHFNLQDQSVHLVMLPRFVLCHSSPCDQEVFPGLHSRRSDSDDVEDVVVREKKV